MRILVIFGTGLYMGAKVKYGPIIIKFGTTILMYILIMPVEFQLDSHFYKRFMFI